MLNGALTRRGFANRRLCIAGMLMMRPYL